MRAVARFKVAKMRAATPRPKNASEAEALRRSIQRRHTQVALQRRGTGRGSSKGTAVAVMPAPPPDAPALRRISEARAVAIDEKRERVAEEARRLARYAALGPGRRVDGLSEGDSFGELCLLRPEAWRNASVLAETRNGLEAAPRGRSANADDEPTDDAGADDAACVLCLTVDRPTFARTLARTEGTTYQPEFCQRLLAKPPSERSDLDLGKLEAFLARMPFVKDLPPRPRSHVCRNMELVRAAPGQCVLRQGDKGDAMFICLEGTLEVRRGSADQARSLGADANATAAALSLAGEDSRASPTSSVSASIGVGLGPESSPARSRRRRGSLSPDKRAVMAVRRASQAVLQGVSLKRALVSHAAGQRGGRIPSPARAASPSHSRSPARRRSSIVMGVMGSGELPPESDDGEPALEEADQLEAVLGPVLGHIGAGDQFGELALLSSSRRRLASVVAATPTDLVRISRADFDFAIRQICETAYDSRVRSLRKVPIFRELSTVETMRLLYVSGAPVRYPRGHTILRAGQPVDALYIVHSGEVCVKTTRQRALEMGAAQRAKAKATAAKGACTKAAAIPQSRREKRADRMAGINNEGLFVPPASVLAAAQNAAPMQRAKRDAVLPPAARRVFEHDARVEAQRRGHRPPGSGMSGNAVALAATARAADGRAAEQGAVRAGVNLATLGEGSWFGEECLSRRAALAASHAPLPKATHTVITTAETELLIFPAAECAALRKLALAERDGREEWRARRAHAVITPRPRGDSASPRQDKASPLASAPIVNVDAAKWLHTALAESLGPRPMLDEAAGRAVAHGDSLAEDVLDEPDEVLEDNGGDVLGALDAFTLSPTSGRTSNVAQLEAAQSRPSSAPLACAGQGARSHLVRPASATRSRLPPREAPRAHSAQLRGIHKRPTSAAVSLMQQIEATSKRSLLSSPPPAGAALVVAGLGR